jgi:two-component system response regulator PilR (NtrC family)
MFRILVVDDEEIIRKLLHDLLSREGFQVDTACDGIDALEQTDKQDYDLLITDITMPRMDGHALLRELRTRAPETRVLVITAFGNIESAVSVIREGASDYIVKPFIIDDVLHRIRKIFEVKELSRENIELRTRLSAKFDFSEIVGKSDGIMQVLALVRKISIARSNVLITGESGTGKEVIARALHASSSSKDGPFLGINCSAIPENLLESELFGYRKGAFTGAYRDKDGMFIAAGNGTLFLDEIGEMPLGLQIKLLRALEERVVHPIGGTQTLPFQARIISATNRRLSEEIERGNFREDLYYRLNVVEIKLPPLRERIDDLPLLIKHFITKKNSELGLQVHSVTDQAMALLLGYGWKGNIRELENVIERAMILSESDMIEPGALPGFLRRPSEGTALRVNGPILPLKQAAHDFEVRYIRSVLEETGDDKRRAASLLGISLASLYRKMEGASPEPVAHGSRFEKR